MASALWRMCGMCNGQFLGHDSRSMGGHGADSCDWVYHCPKCLAKVFVSFDPRPRDVVRFIDGPQWEYVVLAVEGEMVTVRRLGFPEAPAAPVSVHCLYPGVGRMYGDHR